MFLIFSLWTQDLRAEVRRYCRMLAKAEQIKYDEMMKIERRGVSSEGGARDANSRVVVKKAELIKYDDEMMKIVGRN